ncbi:MAG: hypothetical protein DMG07_27120 [Acidobacteria bacterium]|nr:MAG: hypothetical protein DMG07_27120 [Acidobacteriota bacterium]
MDAVASPRAGLDIVRLLIERGADVNAVGGHERRSALSLAISAGHPEKVAALLDAGADIRYRTDVRRFTGLDLQGDGDVGRTPRDPHLGRHCVRPEGRRRGIRGQFHRLHARPERPDVASDRARAALLSWHPRMTMSENR